MKPEENAISGNTRVINPGSSKGILSYPHTHKLSPILSFGDISAESQTPSGKAY